MPWSTSDYPAAMEHLAPSVRAKAIAIANARHRAIPWARDRAEGAD
ncbi:MAG TPA: hypothetical protein VFI86_08950 [Burkholderiales bacterium]|nr:hypothetical protein [Burkholderiales bacterium]